MKKINMLIKVIFLFLLIIAIASLIKVNAGTSNSYSVSGTDSSVRYVKANDKRSIKFQYKAKNSSTWKNITFTKHNYPSDRSIDGVYLINTTSKLADFAIDKTNVFMDSPNYAFYNLKLNIQPNTYFAGNSSTNESYDWAGVNHKNGMCLYHRQGRGQETSGIDTVENVIDIKFNETRGGYNVIGDSSTDEDHRDGLEIGRLAYAMNMAYTANGYLRNTDNPRGSTDKNKNTVYYYFFKAVSSKKLVPKENFTKSANKFADYNNSSESEGYDSNVHAENSAKYTRDYKKLTKYTITDEQKSTDGKILGPFALSYGGSIQDVKITVGDTDVSGTIKWSTDKKTTKSISEGIPNEKKFFIHTTTDLSDYTSAKVKFIQKEVNYYNARLILLSDTGTYQDQNVGIFATRAGKSHGEVEYSVTINVPVQAKLTIKKTDSNGTTPLSAKFKIKTSKGWLQGSRAPYKYNATLADATRYITDATTGERKLEGLEVGKYTIYETNSADQYSIALQSGYDAEGNNGAGWVDFGTNGVANLTKARPEATVKLKNTKYGKIVITKTDDDLTTKLQATFKIYTGRGWLSGKGTTAEPWKYDQETGGTYLTNSETGIRILNGLQLDRTYTVYETKAPTGYTLSLQTGYLETDTISPKSVKCGSSFKLTKTSYSKNIDVTNKKYGKIIITKTDADDTEIKLQATFRIYTGNGWLSGKGTAAEPWKYDQRAGTAFSTNAQTGIKELKGLELGKTYTVYETGAPTGYNLSLQSGYSETRAILPKSVLCRSVKLTKADNEKTVSVTNKKYGEFGKIIVKKVDADNQDIKLKTTFRVYTGNGWLTGKGTEAEPWQYDQATSIAYATNETTGQRALNGLELDRTYTIYETGAPEGYSLSLQKEYSETREILPKSVLCGSLRLTSAKKEASITVTNKKYGKIQITKIDKKVNSKKLKAGFKIKTSSTQWLSGQGTSSSPYKYDSTEANATTYYTNESTGIKTLIKLELNRTYTVYETVAPEGYVLSEQDNYSNGKVLVGQKKLTYDDTVYEITHKNEAPEIISISGLVWEDKVKGLKVSKYNNLYDSGEEIKGVTVTLRNKSDNSIVKTQQNRDITAITANDGTYTLSGIISSYLSNYYVEFDYSKTEYKRCVPVAYNSTDKLGSRALVKTSPVSDAELDKNEYRQGTTYTKLDTGENSYGLTALKKKFYDDNKNIIQNVNFGIRKVIDNQFNIKQDIDYVKISFDGKDYKYIYGGEQDMTLMNAPGVSYKSGKKYTKEIYPSEVAKNLEAEGKLRVYVAYKIRITNTSEYGLVDISDTGIADYYKETKLAIAGELTDKFDTGMYNLETNFEKSTNNDFEKWNISSTGVAKYVGDKLNNGIGPGETKELSIQFKVTNNAVNEILKGEKKEENPVEAFVTNVYHEYTRKDYAWDYNISKNENKHTTPPTNGNAGAPRMIFTLPSDDERKISGTVFKDNINTENRQEGEVVGNGTFEEEQENTIDKVKVELIKMKLVDGQYVQDNSGGPYVYPGLDNSKYRSLPNKDQIQTNRGVVDKNDLKPGPTVIYTYAGGEYSFNGVIPGEYIVKFTYGDGTYKYVDPTGTEISDKKIKVEDYKSTIVTLQSAIDALGFTENQTVRENQKYITEWYKYIKSGEPKTENDETNYSVAIDDLKTRERINSKENITSIDAKTPVTSITIENTIENEIKVDEVDDDDNLISRADKGIFNGFNFGIIEQPRRGYELEKVITNIKLTNSEKQVIINGNPENIKDVQGISDLDNKENGGSTYTRIEIDDKQIYGSTLETTYTIAVKDVSKEITYAEIDDKHYGWYYVLGLKEDAYSRQVGISLEQVIDYLDPTVEYREAEEKIKLLNYTSTNQWKDSENNVYNIEKDINKKYKEILVIADANTLTKGGTKKYEITTTRTLSRNDEDMEILNEIEITKASNNVERNAGDPENIPALEQTIKLVKQPDIPEPAQAKAIVIPPLGENRNNATIYAITGALSFILIITGIVIIKKKVL